jgi:hypothetical protein
MVEPTGLWRIVRDLERPYRGRADQHRIGAEIRDRARRRRAFEGSDGLRRCTRLRMWPERRSWSRDDLSRDLKKHFK